MVRLTVVIASGKPVQSKIEKPLFPLCLGLNERGRERQWRSKNCVKPRQTWRSNIGKREMQIWPFMRSIRSSHLNDFSDDKRVDGQIRLKEIK